MKEDENFLVYFSAMICALGLFMGVVAVVVDAYRFTTASNWPSTPGVVESWNVQKDLEDHTYSCWVSYLYERDGRTYRGWNIYLNEDEILGESFQTEFAAIEALRPYPIGQAVEVKTNPYNQSDTVLDTSLRSLGLFFFGACFIGLLSVAMVIFIGSNFRPVLVIVFLVLTGYGGCQSYFLTWGDIPSAEELSDPVAVIDAQKEILEVRLAWDTLESGLAQEDLPYIREPAEVLSRPEGQVWVYEVSQGLEKRGKLVFKSTDEGMVLEQVVKPFVTSTSVLKAIEPADSVQR